MKINEQGKMIKALKKENREYKKKLEENENYIEYILQIEINRKIRKQIKESKIILNPKKAELLEEWIFEEGDVKSITKIFAASQNGWLS